ncbi:hypothetical protein [Streptomyces sp. NPDC096311]|uniref:hypothetical protein n=1 Tax=Streptomyces sp. NPDC096311 TaxID=3366083 RepID=UPI003816DE6A
MRDALTGAGHTVMDRDAGAAFAALTLDFGYLPGEIWISEPTEARSDAHPTFRHGRQRRSRAPLRTCLWGSGGT